jgi:hypothetical protein
MIGSVSAQAASLKVDQTLSPRRGSCSAGPGYRRGSRGHPRRLQDQRPGRDLPGLGHRRLGSGARQHALARRRGADGRDRLVLDPLEQDGDEDRPRSGGAPRRLAERCGGLGHRGAARRGSGAPDQGGLRRPQRDLDRRHVRHHRGAPRDRRRGSPGAPPRRHDLLARLHRLPPRGMGRRRHGRRFPEGPDAAARPVVQRRLGEGARGCDERADAALLLGLGGDDRGEPQRLLPLHSGKQHAAGAEGRPRHAARGTSACRRR